MRAVFITGTDTGVGKSTIAGLLARYLLEKKYSVITQKWIQTGSRKRFNDIDTHIKLMKINREKIKKYLSRAVCFSFKFPSSPHLAASLEKKRIFSHKIKKNFKVLLSKFDFVIVEGIGGILVPFSKRRLVIEIVKELSLPLIIVAQNRLGAINHTLLTIEAAKRRGLKIIGVIFNNPFKKLNRIIAEDNLRIVKCISKEKILGSLPWIKDKDCLYEKFKPIAEKISKELR